MNSILVVDDNDDLRVSMALSLRMAGHQVSQANDGMEALRAVKESPPDLILLDIMMPGMDGYGVAEALQADPSLQKIPIMLVSAKSNVEEQALGLAMPQVIDYVAKPFAVTELVMRVANALERNG